MIRIDKIEQKSLRMDLGKSILTRIFRIFENLTNLDFGETNGFNRPFINYLR